jgi:hypothetical protein
MVSTVGERALTLAILIDPFDTIFDDSDQTADQRLSHTTGGRQRLGQFPTRGLQIFARQAGDRANQSFAGGRGEFDAASIRASAHWLERMS